MDQAMGAKTAYIERGSPWENGYIESFNARLRDELLDGEIFYSLREAQIVIESWRRHYNRVRPHAALGYKPPATRGIRARPRRVAGCATSNGSAGHASAQANLKLTFHLDYSVGADQKAEPMIAKTKIANRLRDMDYRAARRAPAGSANRMICARSLMTR